MPTMRGEERWVSACLESALPGVQVVQHDDGSQPSMHDLNLLKDGEVFGACEVTAAADAESIELWNVVNGSDEHWVEPDLLGGWSVVVTPRCRARRLKQALPSLLREAAERSDVAVGDDLRERMHELHVVGIHRHDTRFPGGIYVTIERDPVLTGGAVASTGDGLAEWFDTWVLEPGQFHNLDKLSSSALSERHLFVLFPAFTTAPFSASDLLMRNNAPQPLQTLDLPEELTDVWLMSTWKSGDGFHYNEEGWSRFEKVFEVGTPKRGPGPPPMSTISRRS